MAFVHGKTTSVLVDEFDLSPYLSASTAVKNVQTVNVTAYGANDDAFIAGMESGTLSLGGMYDPASGAVGEILDAAIGVESIVTVVIGGYATLGNKCTMLKAETAGWQPRSTVNDAVRITANFVADGGIRFGGVLLQPLEAETAVFNGTAVDNGASTAFGGVGHLHVTAFSGTSGTLKIQDSPDNAIWSDLIDFGSITGVTAIRTEVSGTIDQYLRFAITADTFTSMTVACAFARHRH